MKKREKIEYYKCEHPTDSWHVSVRGNTVFQECFWCWLRWKYDLRPKQYRRTHNQVVIDDRNKGLEKQQCEDVKVKKEVKRKCPMSKKKTGSRSKSKVTRQKR